MAGKGSAPGERRGGRKAGTPNKTTIKKEAEIKQTLHARGFKLAKEYMGDSVVELARLAKAAKKVKDNPAQYRGALMDVVTAASKLAPYQSPTFQSVAYTHDPFDLSKLTDKELEQLEKLRLAATDPGRNPSRESTPTNK